MDKPASADIATLSLPEARTERARLLVAMKASTLDLTAAEREHDAEWRLRAGKHQALLQARIAEVNHRIDELTGHDAFKVLRQAIADTCDQELAGRIFARARRLRETAPAVEAAAA